MVCRILALEKLGAVFNQVAYNLDFTPRKFVVHAESGTGNQFFPFFIRYGNLFRPRMACVPNLQKLRIVFLIGNIYQFLLHVAIKYKD